MSRLKLTLEYSMSNTERGKLLFVHHSSAHGGAGKSMLKAIDSLSCQYDIVLAYPVGFSIPESFKKYNIETIEYNIRPVLFPCYSGGSSLLSIGTLRFLLERKKFEIQISSIVKSVRPDLVLLNSITLAYLGRSIEACNTKALCFVRETIGTRMSIVRKVYLKWLSYFDMVFFISTYDQRVFSDLSVNSSVLRNTYDACAEVIKDPIDESDLSGANPLKVLYVGGDSVIKGYFNLLKVCRELYAQESDSLKPRYQFTVCGNIGIGGGSLKGRCVKYIKSIMTRAIFPNIDEAIANGWLIMVGEVETLKLHYMTTDVVFLPIQKPHQQRPIFEAGAESRPVLVPDFDCLFGSLEDGITGLFYNHVNIYSAIKSLEVFALDRTLVTKMGASGRLKSEKDHSFESYRKNIMTNVTDLVGH
jgi:glycosyltransferase involved in cell wall biosynthesis